MHTERGFSRIVGFSDGVVAIAITLLVLPLVGLAGDLDGDVLRFLQQETYPLFLFVLSFVVIGRFWMTHHQLYEKAADYNGALLWANMLWLLAIVLMPFTTALLAQEDQGRRITFLVYIGNLVVASFAMLLQQLVLIRTPRLQAPETRGTLRLLPFVTPVVILVVAAAIAVAVPEIGLLALLLMLLGTPAELLIDRMRRRRR